MTWNLKYLERETPPRGRRRAGDTRYHLGDRILNLARVAGNDGELRRRLRPVLERLAEEIGETVFLAVPSGDEVYFHTGYRDAEGQSGLLRAWYLDGSDLEAYVTGGVVPPQDQSYLLFPCAPTATPAPALLAAAGRDPAAVAAAFDQLDRNWMECGRPLCGESAERLLDLAR